MYNVIDTKTGEVISKHASLKRASNKVDKLDNAYGGYRYVYRFIQE